MNGMSCSQAEDDAADIVAPRRQPVGEAVGRVEERRQEGQPKCCPQHDAGIGLARRGGGRVSGRHGHAQTRRATETVKMPHWSMRWSSFSKPAAVDQLVHLALRAPAHHPGLAAAMRGQAARDHFELRMPGLVGVDEQAAGLHGAGQSAERAGDHAHCRRNSS